MPILHYDFGAGPYCNQSGTVEGTGDIREVTCLRCLCRLCVDVRKAYEGEGLLMCPFQRARND